MAIKVRGFLGDVVYPHAHSWYSGEDKALQVYQRVGDDNEFVIAEFADGSWENVELDPLPVPPEPEDDEEDRDQDIIENDEEGKK